MECFLCALLKSNEKFRTKNEVVKKFSKDILISCNTFLRARKHHKHKYSDVILPETENDEVLGYHSSCYKEFRVKPKYLSYESSTSAVISPTITCTGNVNPCTSTSTSTSSEIDNLPSTSCESTTTSSHTSSVESHGARVPDDGATTCTETPAFHNNTTTTFADTISFQFHDVRTSLDGATTTTEISALHDRAVTNIAETSSSQSHGTHSPELIEEIAMDSEVVYPSNLEDMHEDATTDSIVSVQSFTDVDLATKCFFCLKLTIKRNGRQIYCRKIKGKNSFLEKIKKYAMELGDMQMLLKIEEVINNADEFLCYHNHCQVNYFKKHQTHQNRPATNDWSLKRNFYKLSREKLIEYVQCEVIEKLRVLSLSHLKDCFSEFLRGFYEMADLDANVFNTHAVRDHIKSELKKKISFVNISNKPFVMSSTIDIENVDDEEIENILFEQEAQDFALKYRSRILKIKKNNLPEFIDSEALDKGECDIPKWLDLFWNTALNGVNKKISDKIERLSSCYSQDSIYGITRGKIKPRKHILLGIAMKSLTGSKKVLEILNRQGYCISYSNVLEIETSAAYSCSSRNLLCPSGIEATSLLSSGVAWDNFDRFVSTSSGKDTLHDTVGIMYQDIPTEEELTVIETNNSVSTITHQTIPSNVIRTSSGRRKRSLESDDFEILQPAKQR